MTPRIVPLASLVCCLALLMAMGCEYHTASTTGATSAPPVKPDEGVAPAPLPATEVPSAVAEEPVAAEEPAEPPAEVAGLTRLGKEYEVWLDTKGKRVYVGGKIVRTEGQLEMFACLKNTKEHESIVAVNTEAVNVNSALIALGASPGGPVQFRPEFKPASGPEVEVTVLWTDKEGKRQQVRAQEWIRDLKTGKALAQPWVFGGSGFVEDEASGERYFMAEDGTFICISNFTSAMLDLPVASSQDTADLQFEAFTERIPPVGTPVLLVLAPKLKTTEGAKTQSD
jgi:hypothetical protein